MTTVSDVQSPGSEPVNCDATVHVCGACGHTGLSHDAIAKRYCPASRDRALDCACVCTIGVSIDETVTSTQAVQFGDPRAHVWARSTQPNVRSPRCALPGYPARSMLVAGPAHLSRGLDQGVDRGEFGPRAPPRSFAAGLASAHRFRAVAPPVVDGCRQPFRAARKAGWRTIFPAARHRCPAALTILGGVALSVRNIESWRIAPRSCRSFRAICSISTMGLSYVARAPRCAHRVRTPRRPRRPGHPGHGSDGADTVGTAAVRRTSWTAVLDAVRLGPADDTTR
jgi:hypothetical protein